MTEDRFPASLTQHQFWLLNQLNPESSAYNIVSCFRVYGTIDMFALKQSVRLLLERHEVLCSTIVEEADGRLCQRILPRCEEQVFHHIELDDEPTDDALPAAVVDDTRLPFDLQHGPLIRVRVFGFTGEPRFLTITMHHTVCDLRTGDIVAADLDSFYRSLICGQAPAARLKAAPYVEFAKWQKDWVEGAECARMLEYWKKETAEVEPLNIPADKDRPGRQSLQGDAVALCFSAEEANRIRQAASPLKVNTYLMLLSAYAIFLHRYSGANRICIGVPLTNRRNEDFADTVGCFVSIVPVVVDCAGNPTVAELVRRIRLKMLGAHRNQEVPFELIAQQYRGVREPWRNPVFQAGFTFDHPMPLKLGEGVLDPVSLHRGDAQLDLFVTLWEDEDTVSGHFEYSTDRFTDETARSMAANYRALVLAMAADPDMLIGSVPVMRPEEYVQVLDEWNRTEMPLPVLDGAHELVRQAAASTPDAIGLCFEEINLTYAELMREVDTVANHVLATGVHKGELVGLCLERSHRIPISILGIWSAGCAYVPLDPEFPRERIDYALTDSRVRVVVTEEGLGERFAGQGYGFVFTDTGRAVAAEKLDRRCYEQEDPAYVMYTSGSTGKPKGVMVPHRALINFLLSMAARPGMGPLDTLVAVTTMSFDISLLELILPLTVGGRVVMADRITTHDPDLLSSLLDRSGASVMQATPITWRMLIEAGWRGRSDFRALCGGEAMPESLRTSLLPRVGELWNMYGPTETTIWSTCYRCTTDDAPISIGTPIHNTTVYVLDRALQPVPVGVRGELYIGGAGLAIGYVNQDELTAERFVPDPFSTANGGKMYRTGDICRFRPDGALEYCYRVDNQVKVRGFRIELGEIDAALRRHPGISQAATVVAADAQGEAMLATCFVPQPGSELAIADLKSHLRSILPPYMVPTSLLQLDALPLTPNGKIDTKAIATAHLVAPSVESVRIADTAVTLHGIPFVYRLSGQLDVDALTRGLNGILERHEVMRTVFRVVNGHAVRMVSPEMTIPVPLVDLTSEADPAGELLGRVRLDAGRPFDRAESPLLRATIFRIAREVHALAIVSHLVVSEGWSNQNYLVELQALYDEFRGGEPSRLPQLPIQQADYAVWLDERCEGQPEVNQLAYWRMEPTRSSTVVLPADRPWPKSPSFQSARRALVIPPLLSEALRSIGRQEKASLYLTLIAAFHLLLHRYNDQDVVPIAITAAEQGDAENAGSLGSFVRTLMMRVRLDDSLTFQGLIKRMRAVAGAGYANQVVPSDKLIDDHCERDVGRDQLLQVLFHDVPVARELRLGEVVLERVSVALDVARPDIALVLPLTHVSEAVPGYIEYNSEIFDSDTIDRLIAHYLVLLTGISENPNEQVSRLTILTEADVRRLAEWNSTDRDFDLTQPLHKLVEAQAIRTPGEVALRFRHESLTYFELNRRANLLAQELVCLGVAPNVNVCVFMERSVELVVSLLAVLKAGGAYVPIDLDFPAQRIRTMLEDTTPAVILVQAKLGSILPVTKTTVLTVDATWADIESRHSPVAPAVQVSPGDAAYVIFTSGSTGQPKGVVNEHRGIVNRLVWMQEEFGLETGDRVLQKTPYGFDVSVWEFFWPLMTGATLVMAEPGGHRDPEYLVRVIRSEQITTLHFVPSMLKEFLEEETGECTSLKRIICSGEVLSLDQAERTLSKLPWADLYNLYGPTEAAVDVTWWHCKRGNLETVPIGRPVANTKIHILDRHGQETPVGIPGELHIGGVQVARGYLGRPELTAERFVADPFSESGGGRLYRTGDLACWRNDGAIHFLGRLDSQVKVAGCRIELGEIEMALESLPGVRQAVVEARGEAEDRHLVAYVILAGGCTLVTSELHRQLSATLPEYMIPTQMVSLDSLPLTASGKVDRQALPCPMQRGLSLGRDERHGNGHPDEGGLENAVVAIWANILGEISLRPEDNFFDVGGTSMSIIHVRRAIQEKLGLSVSIAALFQHPTVAKLAAYLEGIGAEYQQDSMPHVETRAESRKAALTRMKNAAQMKRRPA